MQHMLKAWVQRWQISHTARRFSSIFDVIRERRRELSNVDTADAPTQNDVTETTRQHGRDVSENSITQIWKHFSILRAKPKGYKDRWQLRYLGVRTMQLLPIISAEELCKIADVLAYVKYRNVVLMQGISETLYWHCKLNKCKLRDMTCFLRSCATLKFVPSYRCLELFLAQLDNVHHKPTVGDYMRILQFLVENDLSAGDVFMDMYDRCYKHCLDNMGYMTTHHLSSFSQTQLLIDNTNREVFDRICLNFGRGLKESEIDHFFMLSNALLRSETKEISAHYSRLLGHYLESPEKWDPKLINTVLRVLAKFYHRDMVALSSIGRIIVNIIASFSPNQAYVALNQYSALSYKHKELIHGVMKSQLIDWSIGVDSRLQILAGVSNLLAKVEYKHIDVMKSITENTISSLKVLNGDLTIPPPATKLSHQSNDRRDGHKIPWITYDKVKCHVDQADRYKGRQNRKGVLTGNMVLGSIEAPLNDTTSVKKLRTKPQKSVRRLIWDSKYEKESEQPSVTDLSRLKVVPVSVDVMRRQSLKECLQGFYNEHFDGKHPAWRRLDTRQRMQRQSRQFQLHKGFDRSSILPAVHLEKRPRFKVNRSVRKVKKKMRYAGSRYVQSAQHYINECRVLKRCFLRPYKTVADVQTTRGAQVHGTVNSNDIARVNDDYDTRKSYLAEMWKKYSRACLYRSSLANSFTPVERNHLKVDGLDHEDANLTISAYINDGVTRTSSDTDEFLPEKITSTMVQQLETYVDHTSPIFLDNALILRPVEVSSLFSWRLKRKLRSLQRAHDTNAMNSTISYMLSNGLWHRHEEMHDTYIAKEQPLWKHIFEIVSALHKLNFSSFELLNQVTMALDLAEPLCVELNSSDIGKYNTKETFSVLLKTAKRFGYMVSSISTMLSRDASGIIATRLLNSICSSNILTHLEMHVLGNGVHVPLPEVTGILRRFNSLVFFKYGRHQLPFMESGDTDIPSVSVDGSIAVAPAKAQIMTAYESLHAFAKCSISGVYSGKDVTNGAADEQIVHLMQFLNETVYSTWITSRLSGSIRRSNGLEECSITELNLLPLEFIADGLLKCMEMGSNREVALYAICAIRRYHMLQNTISHSIDVVDVKNHSNDGDGSSEGTADGWKTYFQRFIQRYGFTEETIGNAMCIKYTGKQSVESTLAWHADCFSGDMVKVKPTSDARAAAVGVLHNFYYNHYNVV